MDRKLSVIFTIGTMLIVIPHMYVLNELGAKAYVTYIFPIIIGLVLIAYSWDKKDMPKDLKIK